VRRLRPDGRRDAAGRARSDDEGGRLSGTGRDCVVLLHASLSCGRQWEGVAAALSRCCRVDTPDLLGCGDAPAVIGREAYSLAIESARMLERIDASFGADASFHLVGHSYGGVVALEIARMQPGRVRSAILYEPTCFNLLADPFDREFVRRVVRAIDLLVSRGFHEGAARMFHDFWNGPGVFDRLGEREQASLARGAPKLVLELRAVAAASARALDYADIDVPVHLLGGLRSFQLTRRVLEVLTAVLPDVSLGWIDGDHMAPVNEPTGFADALSGFFPASSGLRNKLSAGAA
jgi:pimeloyl-ACP methyl ester carboxylesterase